MNAAQRLLNTPVADLQLRADMLTLLQAAKEQADEARNEAEKLWDATVKAEQKAQQSEIKYKLMKDAWDNARAIHSPRCE